MLKRMLAILSALVTVSFGALGVHWVGRSRKQGWDLPCLGIGLMWLSNAVCMLLSTCSLWEMANEEDEDGEDDFDDFEIITD